MLLRKFRKYSSEGGFGVEWQPGIDKASIVPIAIGLAVAITIRLSQRWGYFKGIKDLDDMYASGEI